jgi:hypothetical protein
MEGEGGRGQKKALNEMFSKKLTYKVYLTWRQKASTAVLLPLVFFILVGQKGSEASVLVQDEDNYPRDPHIDYYLTGNKVV